MTNGEKYKTPEEQIVAFRLFCNEQPACDECRVGGGHGCNDWECAFWWLALKAEEERPGHCLFCGSKKTTVSSQGNPDSDREYFVTCTECGCRGPSGQSEEQAIESYNAIVGESINRAIKAQNRRLK